MLKSNFSYFQIIYINKLYFIQIRKNFHSFDKFLIIKSIQIQRQFPDIQFVAHKIFVEVQIFDFGFGVVKRVQIEQIEYRLFGRGDAYRAVAQRFLFVAEKQIGLDFFVRKMRYVILKISRFQRTNGGNLRHRLRNNAVKRKRSVQTDVRRLVDKIRQQKCKIRLRTRLPKSIKRLPQLDNQSLPLPTGQVIGRKIRENGAHLMHRKYAQLNKPTSKIQIIHFVSIFLQR